MDFSTTIDLIIKDLNEASEIIDDLKKYPGVPALQVELAKSKCRSAGDVIALLKTLNLSAPSEVEPGYEKQISLKQTEKSVPESPAKATQSREEKKPESEKTINSASPEAKKQEPEGGLKKPVETQIVADKFSHTKDFYEEQSGSIKTEKDLSDRLKSKNIRSLSETIGISDKFLFMGEIFNSNKEDYAEAIARLDKVDNIEDAMTIIRTYSTGESDNDAINQLLELVKLKLGSNE